MWLPAALTAITGLWAVIAPPVPAWWLGPAVVAVVALSGDPVIRLILHLARDAEAQRTARRQAMTSRTPQPPLAGTQLEQREQVPEPLGPPLRGGLIIGVLERLAVVICLALGYPNGVAIVIAVKGLARYGEFTNAHQREQFIIGTLASLLWAAAGAGVIVLAA